MLCLLTLLHFAVDGVCGATLASYDTAEADYLSLLALFNLYNLIAFGGQWLVGLCLDHKLSFGRYCFLASALFLGVGMLPLGLFLQAVLLGLGNCLFHAAGGSMVLRNFPNYTAPGLFVSSGALGLALGLNDLVAPWVFYLLILLATAQLIKKKPWASPQIFLKQSQFTPGVYPYFGLLLLISCVVCRGFGGSPQASEFLLLWPCLTALGKASGGYLVDKFGLAQTIFLFLLLAFLALQIKGLLAAMLLLFAFNLTMPLTLRLAHLCLPKNPGLVFGLLACALLPSAFWPFGISIPTIVLVVFVFLSLAFVKNLSHAT